MNISVYLQVLASHRTLRLNVASPSGPSGYAWVTRDGRPTSPPASWGAPVRKVSLDVEKGRSLGLTIRGGQEYGLGVFIIGIDRHSAADIAGYGMDSFHRRTDISSDKRHQRALLPSQRYESVSLPVRQRRVYGHTSTKRRNRIDDNIIDGCLYEELAESRRL
ncbi:hypothetical protein MRX96_059270 [Rhipicephalus microplus]